ncbi:HAMP domain-containing sensor histidine kinase [Candidatus Nitronereus thalassa]|uniref:histidine kinase n=1 Tax=Candidatus Nitronereus thalassa TaxID=3020898 RepID=A0ABU3K9G2_9BACT|nr:HAMP domain-containing sensor histidine kinase [Candidatus Nitronereus thalassa]MDT7043036.1 HAMP domain-containing sensor histidine kinase [Candidatus Nitronereus thalassa]
MTDIGRMKVAILGGGQRTQPLMELLGHLHDIQIVELSPQGSSVEKTSPSSLLGALGNLDSSAPANALLQPHLVIDTTGHLQSSESNSNSSEQSVEVLKGNGAKLLLELAEQEHQVRGQISHTEKLATVGTMVLGIAHDINNPLHVILGFSENLCDEAYSEEIRDQAKEIHQAAKRIITMCQHLTGYARHGQTHPLSIIDLEEQLDESLKIAKYAASFNRVSILKSYSSKARVLAKAEELTQIFVNLVLNAIQAMNGSGTLTLSSVTHQEKICVKIQDTGPGIPPTHLPKIFEPFFTTKPPGKGTGLGLHSVRTLVHKNQGKIFVESEVGQGTCFHLEFPNPSSREGC